MGNAGVGKMIDTAEFLPIAKVSSEELQAFSCGNEALDEFFREGALAYADELFGKTYGFRATTGDKDLLCLFTVSNASLLTAYLPNARKKKLARLVSAPKRNMTYPAVLIGRLGVSVKYQHVHIGADVLKFIEHWFVEPTNKTGCRYLIVDAYNQPSPTAFYQRNGFDFVFSTEEQEKKYRNIDSDAALRTRLMFFDLMLVK